MPLELLASKKATDAMNNFDVMLLDSIDEILKSRFRELGASRVYRYLKKHSNMTLEELAENPEVFSMHFENLLRSAGESMERDIIENWYSKLGLTFVENWGHSFADYVRDLKKNLPKQK